MRVELGSQIRTSDGKDVGTIEKLVVDPESGEVKTAVVRKGFILSKDIEIPVEAMQSDGQGGVIVNYTADEIDSLPRFVEESYTRPAEGYRSPYGYAWTGLLWPAGYAGYVPAAMADAPAPGYTPGIDRATADEVDVMRQQQDLTSAVIQEGDEVRDRYGEKVGEVHSISVDTRTGKPTKLVVRKGWLFTEDLELAASAIESADDGVVYLTLDKDELKRVATPAQ